jgi:hypothetical protein
MRCCCAAGRSLGWGVRGAVERHAVGDGHSNMKQTALVPA